MRHLLQHYEHLMLLFLTHFATSDSLGLATEVLN
jgi:hypothetical protein